MIRDSDTLAEAQNCKGAVLRAMFPGAPVAAAAVGPELTEVAPAESNILGIGYGIPEDAMASGSAKPVVRVYVRKKRPRRELSLSEIVPATVDGTRTDVIEVGDVRAYRPVFCGVSCGHHLITAGTLGCLVRAAGAADAARYILSNNHVLADSNNATPGDDILEPGPIDGGDPAMPIAELTRFKPIRFGGPGNFMDAAIAELLDPNDVRPDILQIGRVASPTAPAQIYQSVRKHGRTTRHTLGVVVDISADINVGYGNQAARFDDQIGIIGVQGPFSQGGDSGSMIVDAVSLQPVALLFAGSDVQTFGNPIDLVLDEFQVEIV